MSIHRYEVRCSWTGSTGLGYERYDRTHTGETNPATVSVALSADPAFRGDPSLLNPEQLLVLAAASCQLLSFLAVAARARLDILSYEDIAEGFMPADDLPVRLTRIELRPTITIATPFREDSVMRLVDLAHRECYIANSLTTEVIVTPTIASASRRSDGSSAPERQYTGDLSGKTDVASCDQAFPTGDRRVLRNVDVGPPPRAR